ncbi:hypothetical protein GVN24_24675 [Rhizobium sp. CRIBSB]|nr:hypothetical protein [Rhizobium sp. CRIBSB]
MSGLSDNAVAALRTPPAPRLVEIQWLWRRLWVFTTTLVSLAILAGIVLALAGAGLNAAAAPALAGVAYGLIALIAFIGLIYVVGATAYELTQLVTAARVDLASLRPADPSRSLT